MQTRTTKKNQKMKYSKYVRFSIFFVICTHITLDTKGRSLSLGRFLFVEPSTLGTANFRLDSNCEVKPFFEIK